MGSHFPGFHFRWRRKQPCCAHLHGFHFLRGRERLAHSPQFLGLFVEGQFSRILFSREWGEEAWKAHFLTYYFMRKREG